MGHFFSGSMFNLFLQTWDDLLIIGSFSFRPILWGFDTQGFDGLNGSITRSFWKLSSCLRCDIFSHTLFNKWLTKTLYSTIISRIPSPWSHSQKVGNYRSDSLTSAFGTRMSLPTRHPIESHETSLGFWFKNSNILHMTWKPPHMSWSSSRAVVCNKHTLEIAKTKTNHLKDHWKSDTLEVEVAILFHPPNTPWRAKRIQKI